MGKNLEGSLISVKLGDFTANIFKSTKVLMATTQGRCRVTTHPGKNSEPLNSRLCISTTVQQSRVLACALATWERGDTVTINHYNKQFDEVMFNILDFIQLHYFTERTDTEFWRWCKNSIKMTDFNAEHLETFKKNFINQLALSSNNYNIFDILDWAQVMHGLRMFDTENIRQIYETRHAQYA